MTQKSAWYEIMPDLFEACHEAKITADGKAIADAQPNGGIASIQKKYKQLKASTDFDLKAFFNTHFTLAQSMNLAVEIPKEAELRNHIKNLWQILVKKPEKQTENSSLITLPKNYIVPGGRFTEIYYWDSYFTMLGLKAQDEMKIMEDMVDNFTYLIDTIGYIPNGNRLYYVGRSQPPFYSHMIELLASVKGEEIYQKYQLALEKEYKYWMDEAIGKAVSLSENETLNRYMDTNKTPRIEMFQDDVELVKNSENAPQLFADVRAACESGWDFSSRWFKNKDDLSSIMTTAIVPIDLNCLLYHLEISLAKAFKEDSQKSHEFQALADQRKANIQKYLWSEKLASFTDFDFQLMACREHITAACAYPLFVKIASQEQADKTAKIIEEQLLEAGGVLTTTLHTGQQWDAPNGWAPLQWVAYKGLKNYGHDALADEIKQRWMALNEHVFERTGKMMEKYNVADLSLDAGGGEYPVQDGFGWSNGVYAAMLMDC